MYASFIAGKQKPYPLTRFAKKKKEKLTKPPVIFVSA